MSVRKILSTKTPGDKGGGGGGSIQAPTVPGFDPSVALNAGAGDAGQNEITLGGGEESQGGSVIRAFVVSDDMTTQQEKDKKINDLARL